VEKDNQLEQHQDSGKETDQKHHG